ncbi:hypothetical protein ACH9EU_12575 [Kocuria sp. M1R5S2]|uniref:hypothetical protein n=1 Tax=Kocuria rhizosphaerae TaxID=3376285 RepID=UPI0037BD5231
MSAHDDDRPHDDRPRDDRPDDGRPAPGEDGPRGNGVAGRASRGPSRGSRLRTAGELVEAGGWAGGLATLLYVVIGMGFWSLVGWGADRLLGTQWIVVLGACIGAASGIYIVYLHLQDGLTRGSSSDGQDPDDTHPSGPDSAPRP